MFAMYGGTFAFNRIDIQIKRILPLPGRNTEAGNLIFEKYFFEKEEKQKMYEW